MSAYDVTIIHRIYPKVSREPAVFQDSKYDLARFCVNSLKQALGSLRAKVIVLFDNCPREYEALFADNFARVDLDFIHLEGVGNQATFGKQIEVLLAQADSEVVYFSEDDYFYLPNAFEEMIEFLARENVDFVSPYDHLDYYNFELHRHKVMVQATARRHWKTANSTCLTFMTTKKTLQASRRVFESYTRGNQDSSLWLCLTKEHLCNPKKMAVSALKWMTRSGSLADLVVLVAWRYCWLQVLFGKTYRLWTPMPTLAIHLEKHFLPPTEACVQLMFRSAVQQRRNGGA
jgi:hypothetical protein